MIKKTSRKILYFALFIVVIAMSSVTVFADSTTLTTQVPNHHTMQIEISGAGTVTVNGIEYSRSSKINVARFSDVTLSIKADNGYVLKNATLNSASIIDNLQNYTFLIDDIGADIILKLEFSPQASPYTKDTPIESILVLMTVSLICIVPFIIRKSCS